ncbi:MAG: M48 family metallopeptidase [Longimicrobiales bacterium]
MLALRSRMRKGLVLAAVAGTGAVAASCSISQQREIELGQQYAADINRQLPIVDDAAVNRYINALGDEIAVHGDRDIDYRFYIVNSDIVNAFAVPGGFVYVNRGLVEAADNMSELAGVIAHEIGHVEERHSVEQMERLQGANLGLNLAYILLGRRPSGVERAAIDVGGGLVFSSYSRKAEEEADQTAIALLVAADINPEGLVTFFDELLEQRSRRPSQLEQWFSTHPLTEDRIDHVQQVIDRTPGAQAPGLQTQSNAFAAFKAQLRQYPEPPPEYRARN